MLLEERLNAVNQSYFESAELPRIRWSKGVVKKRYRKITFGCYDYRKNEIRIHPILDHADIPLLVLDFVIFHEMLHFEDREYLKSQKRERGKRKIHTRDFKKREKVFKDERLAGEILRKLAYGQFFTSKKEKPLLKKIEEMVLFPGFFR